MATPKNSNKMKLEVFWKMILKTAGKVTVSNAATEGTIYLCVCLTMSQASKTKTTADIKTADRMFASFK